MILAENFKISLADSVLEGSVRFSVGLGCYRRTPLRQGYNRPRETHLQGANPGLGCGQNVLVPSVSVSQPISAKAWVVLRSSEGFSAQKGSAEHNAGLKGSLEASLRMFSIYFI